MKIDPQREAILFAVHAVQLGFATPVQVADASREAKANPKLKLADLLVRDGVLNVGQRQVVERRIDREMVDGSETLSADPSPEQAPGTAEGPPTVRFGSGIESTLAEPPSIDPGSLDDEVDDQVSKSQPGRYTIQGRHAAGGQARIMLAIDEHIGREVAIKELFPEDGSGEWSGPSTNSVNTSTPGVVRFLREARVTGQLEHPNIVPVHEVGLREDGTYYYTMRFVRGDTLARKLKACRTLDDRMVLLGAFHDVCNALSFAHSRGVVHRDIKPENIMVGEFGETVVIDWGVAKVEGKRDLRAYDIEKELRFFQQQDVNKTAAGTAIGTPSYMSPEQAHGDIDRIDERSDVWGLGAVLYEILTGKPPYTGNTPMDIILKVGEEPLVPVRERCPQAPAELAAVAEKALQKKRSRRYQRSKEFTDEISAYMTGRRVAAYEYSSWELLKRFASQNKGTILAVVLILSVIIGALISVSFSLRAESSARLAEHEALQKAEAAAVQERIERRMASFHLAQALTEKADGMMASLNNLSAAVFAAASLVHNPAHPMSSNYDPGFASHFPHSRELWVQAASRLYRLSFAPGAELLRIWQADEVQTRLAFSPDGRHLAVGSFDKTIRIWSLAEGGAKPRLLSGHIDEVYGLAFSPDGRLLASGDGKGMIIIRNLNGDRIVHQIEQGKVHIHDLDFTPDGAVLATAGWDGQIRLFDVRTGAQTRAFAAHREKVNALAFSPDGEILVTAGADKLVRLWDWRRGKMKKELRGHEDEVYAVAFSPDGALLATAGNDFKIALWSVVTGRRAKQLVSHSDGILNVAFSPDGRKLVSASYDKTVRTWDVASGSSLLTIGGHSNFVYDAAFSPDGQLLATSSYDKSARLWKLKPGQLLPELKGHTGTVYSVGHSADGRLMATGSWDKTLRIWDARSGKTRHILRGHRDIIDNLAFAPDSKQVATASRDRTVRIWDAIRGRALHELRHPDEVPGLAYSPDGSRLVTVCYDKRIRLWNPADGTLLKTIEGPTEAALNVAFSPDGLQLASVGRDRQVRLFDARTGQAVKTLSGHSDWSSGIDFSPDGRRLASAGKDGLALIWDRASGQILTRLGGHDQWVNTIKFSTDGRTLATGSDDRTVRLWSTEDGKPLLVIRARAEVVAIDFSPDKHSVAVGDAAEVKRYPLDFSILEQDPDTLLEQAERAAGMTLEGFELKVSDDLR